MRCINYPSYPVVRRLRPSLFLKVCGGYIGGVTPVPIPNTEVKPTRADGTAREAVWESRSLPHLFHARRRFAPAGFFLPCARAALFPSRGDGDGLPGRRSSLRRGIPAPGLRSPAGSG